MFGIAARNAIMLISHFRHLELQEEEVSGGMWSCAARSNASHRS